MSRVCTICSHPQREAIDRALAAGQGVRTLASRYATENGQAVGRQSLQRHRETCLPASVVEKAGEEATKAALDVVAQLKAINGASLQILSESRKANDPETSLKAVDRILRQLELQAKLLGQIDDRPTINVLVLPEWLSVRERIITALLPYPEAAAAVSEALQ